MEDGGDFSPTEVVAFLATHTITGSHHIDPAFQTIPSPSPLTPKYSSTSFSKVLDSLELQTTLVSSSGLQNTLLCCVPVNCAGEALSPLPLGLGIHAREMRLQSDFLIAREPCIACTWPSFVNE